MTLTGDADLSAGHRGALSVRRLGDQSRGEEALDEMSHVKARSREFRGQGCHCGVITVTRDGVSPLAQLQHPSLGEVRVRSQRLGPAR